jgi:hypothetical protein
MVWYIAAAAILLAKFFTYALYARSLNTWFGATHNPYRVSGVRILLSLLFTGINTLIGKAAMDKAQATWQLIPVIMSIVFACIAWYILLRIFYGVSPAATRNKALLFGTLISMAFAGISAFLALIGLLNSVNFC